MEENALRRLHVARGELSQCQEKRDELDGLLDAAETERDALRKTNRRWDFAYAEITRKLHAAEDERDALRKALVAVKAHCDRWLAAPAKFHDFTIAQDARRTVAILILKLIGEHAGAEIEGPK